MNQLMTERLSIYERGRHLSYDLRRSDRKTLEISVYPDGRVAVTAPHETEIGKIESKVRKRFLWIDRNIRKFEQFPQPLAPRQWISGETHRYLGRQYRLKVETGEKSSVKLKGSYFHVLVANKADPDSIRAAMELWRRDRAHQIFEQRLNLCLRISKPFLGIDRVDIIVRKMKNRWGSCTPTGRIVLNLDLIQVPIQYHPDRNAMDKLPSELCGGKLPPQSSRTYIALSFMAKIMGSLKSVLFHSLTISEKLN